MLDPLALCQGMQGGRTVCGVALVLGGGCGFVRANANANASGSGRNQDGSANSLNILPKSRWGGLSIGEVDFERLYGDISHKINLRHETISH